jgi:ribosome-associated toxin RatA of RatAB toxin-antitoxin module
MPRIDVVDVGIIDKPPSAVFKAYVNEVSGLTSWYMPIIQAKPQNNALINHVGAAFDVKINPLSRANARFSCKVTEFIEPKLIKMDITGDFLGQGTWTFEPMDNDKTKVQIHFDVTIKRMMFRLLSRFVDMAKGHSEVRQKGFKVCNDYLCKE